MQKLLALLFLCLCALTTSAQTVASPSLPTEGSQHALLPYAPMAKSAEFLGPAVADPDWFNWCSSPIIGEDGRVYLFISRWPLAKGMEGWTSDQAEIALYVADKPTGPFKFLRTMVNTAMMPKGMAGPHNPRIKKVDDKYVLLFIAQTEGTGREGQRILMMESKHIAGPWHLVGDHGILLSSSTDPANWNYHAHNGVTNPDILKIGRQYFLYFKSNAPQPAQTTYGYAVADRLEGPYRITGKPVTENVGVIEDVYAFATGGRYYLLTTDNMGKNTGIFGDLMLWSSATGKQFARTDAQIAMGNIFDYWGTPEDHAKLAATPGHFNRSPEGKLERPSLLLVDGKPKYLYAVADQNIHGGPASEIYVFKILW